MSWAGIANNQCVSLDNLKDAVATGVFTQLTTIPTGTEQITKLDAVTYVSINTSSEPLASKSNNQLVVKGDLIPTGATTTTTTTTSTTAAPTTTTTTSTTTAAPTTTTTTTSTTTAAPTTTTTTTTTTATSCAVIQVYAQDDGAGNYSIYAALQSGQTFVSISFDGEVEFYSDTLCTTRIGVECPFTGLLLSPSTAPAQVSQSLCSKPTAVRYKITLLNAAGVSVTTSPQEIIDGEDCWSIVGFGLCNNA